MHQELTFEQARRIAALARAAREARDSELRAVPVEDFGEPPTARGEHNPLALIGFEPLAPDSPPLEALRGEIGALTPKARAELYALLKIGQGDLAAGNWERGIEEAEMIGDGAVGAMFTEDPDLHDHLLKGLYQIEPR